MRFISTLFLLLFVYTPVQAEKTEVTVTAPNGVVVTVHGDDFDGRYEYTAPRVEFAPFSVVLVAQVVEKIGWVGPRPLT